ncbi:ATP-dependent nuclease [Lysinibacillus capsici]|uniref:ATP-dependent nuclease n=1 Tax=Lysinibacillus capsici TaxID=2115968 RepID=UPI003D73DD64
MYVSKLTIKNFRCFNNEFVIDFKSGMNVIIGGNNSGKTTIFKAIELVFGRTHSKSLTIDDFNKSYEDFLTPPSIEISIILSTEETDSEEDKALIAGWLTKFDTNWEATLTFKYFLPESNLIEYELLMSKASSKEEKWFVIEKLLPKFVYRIFGGNPINKLKADPEMLEKIHCEVLGALRDVDSKMASGKSYLLKQVLLHFKDKKTEMIEAETEDIEEAPLTPEEEFNSNAKTLVSNLVERIDVTDILKLAKNTGASVGGEPSLRGTLSEADVLSILNLILKTDKNLEIPIGNNGLGYNNLIYISLILAKFKVITSESQGENAKTFPILLIEEPEAHLHPALQYNFLKFLQKEVKSGVSGKQIFITTHSTQITSAVDLDSIICIEQNEAGKLVAKYPAKVFSDSEDDIKSKKYIERFLDATKSAMLFSKSVLLVEGMAELILFPVFAERLGYSLEEQHISIVKVDSVSFRHFLKLFGAGIEDDRIIFALCKKVACVTDKDPLKKQKVKNARWKKSWPYEINTDIDNFDYQDMSFTLRNLIATDRTANAEIFYNKKIYGKTLEFDLAWENFNNEFFIRDLDLQEEIVGKIHSISDVEERKRAEVATKFLEYADNQKGEVAFELAYQLKDSQTEMSLIIPGYIEEAIKWVSLK